MRETSTPTRAVESPSENEVSRFMHLRAPSEELSGGEAGHRNWESAADLGIVGHERNLQLLDHARFFFGRALSRWSRRQGGDMKNAKTTLYETLKRQILTLELPPDQDLDEVRLSEEYGISRTPVRDVLRQLSGEGYIDIRENRGARVIPMNHSTLRDFFLVAPMIYEAVGRLAL